MSFAASFDAESLSYLAKLLYTNQPALDIVSLHMPISELIAHALVFIEDYDCEVVGACLVNIAYIMDFAAHVDFLCEMMHR